MNVYDYLQKQTTAPDLTEPDAAMLLIAHKYIHFSDLQLRTLIDRLHGQSLDWITNTSLFSTTLRLLALAKYDSHLLDGAVMAFYIKRLISAEISPGGPYKVSEGESEIITNAAIAQLFITLTMPLPKIEQYLRVELQRFSIKEISPTDAWILFWPNDLSLNKKSYHDITSKISPIARSILSLPELNEDVPPTTRPNIVAQQVLDELKSLNPLLHSTARTVWRSIVAADKHSEITLLSSHFTNALSAKNRLKDADLLTLNRANFYSWMAYTQYDDFIDSEGMPLRLPIANIAHRKAYTLYNEFSLGIPYASNRINTCFDQMDRANLWELTYCRHSVAGSRITINALPSYRNKILLAQRAGAHILGPLLILESCRAVTPKQRHLMHQYLAHYLIARQINDDMHDWKDDLAHGHSSFVVTFLLRKTKITSGTYTLARLTEILQTYFWKKGLRELHEIILHHTSYALTSATASKLFTNLDNQFIATTIRPIINSVTKGMSAIDNQKTFLDIYSRKL
ncbi:hypothetical protein HY312_02180 [Candidatus Saccharibacteria bacterium]|nr:hypothetical protein [Candidatus Saccharibacteria bacterium]